MNNLDFPDGRRWSPARKGFAIGALTGIFATIVSQGIIIPFFNHFSSENPWLEALDYLSPAITVAIEFPTYVFFYGSYWGGAHPITFLCLEHFK